MAKLHQVLKSIMIILCIGSLCVAGVFSHNKYNEYNKLKAQEAELLERIAQEEKTQQKLEMELEYSLTDAYVEKVARERLGLVKSTDIIYINENQ